MPAQRPMPPAGADHDAHDVLLIAQVAAGDTIDTTERRRAESLLAGCPACAALARDLRAMSGAVAWEPLPPRRRDFRIDPEQAARLRGSRWQRFLRRISLPEARSLRPAALGAMSIGLLFVVAGSVWPVADRTLRTDPDAGAPAVNVQPLEEGLPAGDAPAEGAPADDAPAADARAAEPLEDLDASGVAASPAGIDTSAGEALDQSVAASDGPATEAEGMVATEALQATHAVGKSQVTDGTAEGVLREQSSLDVPVASARALPFDAQNATTPAAGAPPASAEAALVLPMAASALPADALVLPDAPVPAGEPDAAEVVADEARGTVDEPDIAGLLVVVGVVLAATGALVLLLAWFSRRAADPLLR